MDNISFFQEKHALESLRNNDFDTISAYGEVIDNSIQANAKKIKIYFDVQIEDRGYEDIKEVAFGDDGTGMDAATLHRCLQIGWSTRYNDRSGIGRFGVGMTLAAIHECERVEIYSRCNDGKWLWTYMDLEEIENGNLSSIPEPTVREPLKYKHLVDINKTGTVVIWKKYDRQNESAAKIKNETNIWIGRTYRYFIWDGIEISINGEIIHAIDPLYARTEKTRFPDDPKAEVYKDMAFKWYVDELDAPSDSPKESEIIIRMSLLPEEFRPRRYRGGTSEVKKRYIDMNEGISILRNRREVFYGHIPYWKIEEGSGWSHFDDIDRWWGCEVHFNPILDRAFTVKNIKRGAVPCKELKEAIKKKIQPTRDSCLERVKRIWDHQDIQEKKMKSTLELKRAGDHTEAEEVAKITPTDKSLLDVDKNAQKEIEEYMKKKNHLIKTEERAKYKALFESQPFTIMEDTWRGPHFFESEHLGGTSILDYNMSHIFFCEVYGILATLDSEDLNSVDAAEKMKALLDLLIIAYAKAEAHFSPKDQFTAQQFIERLRVNWGQYLDSYVDTWKKEREQEKTE